MDDAEEPFDQLEAYHGGYGPADPPPKTRLGLIAERFGMNMLRIQSLIENASRINSDDVLRSAVVMLHATTEDMMRSLLVWRLPLGEPDDLDGLYCDVIRRKDTVSLVQLQKIHPDMTVRQVVTNFVRNHMERETFNRPEDLMSWFNALHVDPAVFASKAVMLKDMMLRRHAIVHRGDRGDITVDSHGQPEPIDAATVKAWLASVTDYCQELIVALMSQELYLRLRIPTGTRLPQ